MTSEAVAVSDRSGPAPVLTGSVQLMVELAFCAAVAETPVGGVGAPIVIGVVAGEGTLVPSALVATTWNE